MKVRNVKRSERIRNAKGKDIAVITIVVKTASTEMIQNCLYIYIVVCNRSLGTPIIG